MGDMKTCPLCRQPAEGSFSSMYDVVCFDCDNCGGYSIDRVLVDDLEGANDDRPFKLACLLCEQKLRNPKRSVGVFYEPDISNVNPNDRTVLWQVDELLARPSAFRYPAVQPYRLRGRRGPSREASQPDRRDDSLSSTVLHVEQHQWQRQASGGCVLSSADCGKGEAALGECGSRA